MICEPLVTPTKSPSEFVSLWTVHARRVYAYIFSLVPNATDADDLLQETSLVLLTKFDEVGPDWQLFGLGLQGGLSQGAGVL